MAGLQRRMCLYLTNSAANNNSSNVYIRMFSSDGSFPSRWMLNTVRDNPGAILKKRRVGRGPGSRRGKMSGRGMKGRNARSGSSRGKFLFEGGQTPLVKRVPKHGFSNNQYRRELKPLNLCKVMEWVSKDRIDPSKTITLKVLYDTNIVGNIKHGVKLLGEHHGKVTVPLHFEVTDCSEGARKVVEASGGSVKLVWFNRVGLRAHLKPHKFDVLPRTPGIPPPKYRHKYEEQYNELRDRAIAERKKLEA